MSRRPAAEVSEHIADPDWNDVLDKALDSKSGTLSQYTTMHILDG